jgi:hypothetical protein
MNECEEDSGFLKKVGHRKFRNEFFVPNEILDVAGIERCGCGRGHGWKMNLKN